MKKFKILFIFILFLTSFFCTIRLVSAAYGGVVNVYYLGSSRQSTFTSVKANLTSAGMVVYGYDSVGNSSIESHLRNGIVLIVHNHGSPGRQYLGAEGVEDSIVGTNGNGSTLKAVSSMTANSTKKMGMAIYFGCSTGVTTSSYGDLAQQTVNKFSKSAIAWSVTTYVSEVNDWISYLTSHVKNTTLATGASALQEADYKLRLNSGSTAGDRMQLNRIERGTFTWRWRDL